MTTRVLICDDSSFARKQMATALPSDWNVEVSFAKDGKEGVEALKAGKGEILFLDLNMPIMDGYEVLEAIRAENLDVMTIVISGDVQPQAHRRVLQLGALDFIKKPVDKIQLEQTLNKFGIDTSSFEPPPEKVEVEFSMRDGYQEVANVAMGRAADLLARLLDAFVVMPIPSVNTIEVSELSMALQATSYDKVSAVCQGFIGAGIAGEALLIFNESSFKDFAELMKYDGEIDDAVEMELVMDIASILTGACLKGIAEQLDIHFSQGQPNVLGRHIKIADLLKRNQGRWKETLAIEMGYTIENRNINCDLLLLFTEDSIEPFNELVSYLIEE